ncbi:MAG: hypothetical protein FWF72_07350 [Paludibacter sp.]|nr:hypothetical protein [Paludibacter sp.]
MNKFSFRSFGGIMMLIACALMVYMLIFTHRFDLLLPKAMRIIFAVIFGLYGIARAYQILKIKK